MWLPGFIEYLELDLAIYLIHISLSLSDGYCVFDLISQYFLFYLKVLFLEFLYQTLI